MFATPEKKRPHVWAVSVASRSKKGEAATVPPEASATAELEAEDAFAAAADDVQLPPKLRRSPSVQLPEMTTLSD